MDTLMHFQTTELRYKANCSMSCELWIMKRFDFWFRKLYLIKHSSFCTDCGRRHPTFLFGLVKDDSALIESIVEDIVEDHE